MFNAYKYIQEKYGIEIIDEYESSYGLNGRDLLLSSNNEGQVDKLLENMLNSNNEGQVDELLENIF